MPWLIDPSPDHLHPPYANNNKNPFFEGKVRQWVEKKTLCHFLNCFISSSYFFQFTHPQSRHPWNPNPQTENWITTFTLYTQTTLENRGCRHRWGNVLFHFHVFSGAFILFFWNKQFPPLSYHISLFCLFCSWFVVIGGFHLRKDEMKQMRVVVLSLQSLSTGWCDDHFLGSWFVDCWVYCRVNCWVVSVMTIKVNTKADSILFRWKNMWAWSEMLVQ
jgi:hypothetical protein